MSTTPLSPGNRKKIQNLLSEAILKEDIPRVHKLLMQGADPSTQGGHDITTPLMDAARTLNHELIRLFLPMNDAAAVNKDNSNALQLFTFHLSRGRASQLGVSSWRRSLALLISATPLNAAAGNESPLAIAAEHWSGSTTNFSHAARVLAPISDFAAQNSQGLTPCAAALASQDPSGGRRAAFLLDIDPKGHEALLPCSPCHGSLAHVAARHGRTEFLAKISSLADLGSRDSRGRTPLMAAVERLGNNASFCIEFLLRHGVDAQAIDDHGCDALMLLIENIKKTENAKDTGLNKAISSLAGQSNLWLKDFLGESALDKAQDRKLDWLAGLILSTREAATPPTLESPPSATSPAKLDKLQELLFQAIERGETSLVKKRLAQGACPLRTIPHAFSGRRSARSLCTPLIAATDVVDNLDMIRLLAPLSDLLAVDSQGNTALLARLRRTQTTSRDDLEAIEALFSPEAAQTPSIDGMTPLMALSCNALMWQSAIAILGPVSDWMALDAEGNNVLARKLHRLSLKTDHLAIWDAHPNQAWLASSTNHAGETIAHLAASRGGVGFLATIAPHVDFAAKRNDGMTPLLSACHSRLRISAAAPMIKTLAAWSDCHAVDINGCDALMLLIETTARECNDFLLCAEELVGRVDLDARDFLGESALDKATGRGFSGCCSIIGARMAIFAERDELERAAPIPASTSSERALARI